MIKFLTICIMIQCAAACSVLSAETTTVLAFGDSITERQDSYRSFLVPALAGKGLAVEFVGPKRDAISRHAGYSGKNTKYLRSVSKEIYSEYPADIVMIHSGHNSFSKDQPVPGIIRDTEAIINNIRQINPEVQILLAQVIPAGKLPKYSYIPELNTELESLAKRLTKEGAHITLVNQAVGFDWKTDTAQDMVHPNASGARKMSDHWMAALLPDLGHTKQKITDWAIHPQLPPALIFSTRDDRTAPTQKAEQIAKAFREAHVPVQLEIYERGRRSAGNKMRRNL